MVPADASRSPMNTQSAVAPELAGFATCPSCHTADTTLTNLAVSGGADWNCGRCGQRWGAARLATVAAYAVWLSQHTAQSDDRAHAGGAV